MKCKIVFKGGSGSGNHGHAGRKGKVGGSSGGKFTEVPITAASLRSAAVGDKVVYYSKAGKPSYHTLVSQNADGSFQAKLNKDRTDPNSEPSPTAKSSSRVSGSHSDTGKLLVREREEVTTTKIPTQQVQKADDLWFEYDDAAIIKGISAGAANPASDSPYPISDFKMGELREAAATLQTLATTENSGHKTVWRGTSMLDEYTPQYTKVGNVVSFTGLTASSPNKSIAMNYTDPQYSGGEGRALLMKISNSSGITGHNTTTGFADTGGETLLAHNSKYKITDVTERAGLITVYMTQQ